MEIKELMSTFPFKGKVTFLCIRPKRLDTPLSLDMVEAITGTGLKGDRYNHKGGTRQVTLIQEEHLTTVASFLQKGSISPLLTRRNIVVQGINLLALKGRQFSIGETILEYSGECHPCSRMETNLGTGGYNAMRGHGGITAKILSGDTIKVGDMVAALIKSD